MNLVDDVMASLPRMRAAAEGLMVDACLVGRPAEVYTDQTTGQVVNAYTTVYEGKCKIQITAGQSAHPEAGGAEFTVQQLRLDIPVAAGPVAVDDTVTVTACAQDPQLVGTVLRIVEVFRKSMATAQRTRVEWVSA